MVASAVVEARRRWSARGLVGALAVVLVLLPAPLAAEENDPFEPVNRAVFAFNEVADGLVLRPVAILYRGVVPEPARKGVHNFFGNLASPVVFANNLLQGDVDAAGNTLARFLVNSTIGIFGLIDVADGLGYPRADQDFGLTLARHGVGEGPYLVLPLLGPSNPRDVGGRVVDFFIDPFTYVAPMESRVGRSATEAVDFRERNLETIDDLREQSLDFYAALRSIYRQQRASAAGREPLLDDPAYEDIFRDEDWD
jgi:phospholipid-binding lipoprotein MlaA